MLASAAGNLAIVSHIHQRLCSQPRRPICILGSICTKSIAQICLATAADDRYPPVRRPWEKERGMSIQGSLGVPSLGCDLSVVSMPISAIDSVRSIRQSLSYFTKNICYTMHFSWETYLQKIALVQKASNRRQKALSDSHSTHY